MSSTEKNESNPNNLKTDQEKKGGLSKFALILIVVVLLAAALAAIRFGVIAAPGWLIRRMPPQLAPAVSQMTGLGGEEAKLALMMETGRSGVCSMKDTESNTEATYYVKGDKFKVEVTDQDEETGRAIDSFILSDGEYQYTWSSTEDQGVKFKLPSEEEAEDVEEQLDEYDEIDFDWDDELINQEEDNYEISCQFKNVSDSEFAPPQDVEFLDFSEGFGQPFDMESEQVEETDSEETAPAADGENEFEMPSEQDLENMEEWAKELEENYQGTE